MADPPGETPKHASLPKIQYFRSLLTHLDPPLLFSDGGFRYIAGHPVLTNSGLLSIGCLKQHPQTLNYQIFTFLHGSTWEMRAIVFLHPQR